MTVSSVLELVGTFPATPSIVMIYSDFFLCYSGIVWGRLNMHGIVSHGQMRRGGGGLACASDFWSQCTCCNPTMLGATISRLLRIIGLFCKRAL